jgi:hypothetical protein
MGLDLGTKEKMNRKRGRAPQDRTKSPSQTRAALGSAGLK